MRFSQLLITAVCDEGVSLARSVSAENIMELSS